MSSMAAPSASAVPTANDVSVVICAYTEQRWDEIVRAVESALGQPGVGEVCVVIDHNDGLFERTRAHFGERIKVVVNNHKQGLSGARNSGIEHTSKAIVAFLDDDAEARDDWLDQLVAPYARPEVMGVGGYIEPRWASARPRWWPREFDWVIGCSYLGLPTSQTRIRNAIGANMSVRRLALEEAGGFSSAVGRVGKVPLGAEETELFIRIHRRIDGAEVIFQPTAIVDHKVGTARCSFDYFRRRCYSDGLSKAIVSQLDKGNETLTSEWTYTLRTLPLGVLRGIGQGLRGDAGGLGRSGAIVAGLAITTLGYLRGRMNKGPERNLAEVPHSPEAP